MKSPRIESQQIVSSTFYKSGLQVSRRRIMALLATASAGFAIRSKAEEADVLPLTILVEEKTMSGETTLEVFIWPSGIELLKTGKGKSPKAVFESGKGKNWGETIQFVASWPISKSDLRDLHPDSEKYFKDFEEKAQVGKVYVWSRSLLSDSWDKWVNGLKPNGIKIVWDTNDQAISQKQLDGVDTVFSGDGVMFARDSSVKEERDSAAFLQSWEKGLSGEKITIRREVVNDLGERVKLYDVETSTKAYKETLAVAERLLRKAASDLVAGKGRPVELDFLDDVCFVTTACCGGLGLADDCWELRTLRRFRDRYLRFVENGSDEIAQYYDIGPSLTSYLKGNADATLRTYRRLVFPCAILTSVGLNNWCHQLYRKRLQTLVEEAASADSQVTS